MVGQAGNLVQVIDDGTAAQVEEILADPALAGASSLPVADVRQGMFDRHALAQFCPPRRRRLALAQFAQQAFVGMNGDTAPVGARRAARLKGARRAPLLGKVDRLPPTKRNHNLVGAGDRLVIPI
jgi:hypothetical protein